MAKPEDEFMKGAEAMRWHIVDAIKSDIKTQDYILVLSARSLADLADADKTDERRQSAKVSYERDKAAKSTLELLAEKISNRFFRENFAKQLEKTET